MNWIDPWIGLDWIVCVLITWSLSLLWAASCDERFFPFLAVRHRAILFSMFVLLVFVARWHINMTMMMMMMMIGGMTMTPFSN